MWFPQAKASYAVLGVTDRTVGLPYLEYDNLLLS